MGGMELVVIGLVALLVLGPERMLGAAKTTARMIREVREALMEATRETKE